jgi:hypothetical protein
MADKFLPFYMRAFNWLYLLSLDISSDGSHYYNRSDNRAVVVVTTGPATVFCPCPCSKNRVPYAAFKAFLNFDWLCQYLLFLKIE